MIKIKIVYLGLKLFILILSGSIILQLNAQPNETDVDNSNDHLAFEEQIEMECEQQFNVTSDELKSIEKISLTNEAKCFVKCLLEKTGTLKDGKIIDIAMVKDMENDCEAPLVFDKHKAELLVGKCKKAKGIDDCDFALNYMICVLKDFGNSDGYCTIKN
ncbi:general odorant-binding protein 56h-like [Condylostylus longicornis]|uniref:general odorant-binding protein 56h-like n=1 Tax=Condylostylus longicornis TaxID=2530218 RepID=UPI00244E1B23|nr:general odorant-binding protein 56h-like [Condylostylus longicornis]